ncbi:MAG: hypothetical protein FWD17_10360 [Polyangiaceae bacterium]|nr:hypothetical protein [Polyangiaceae bacterium]
MSRPPGVPADGVWQLVQGALLPAAPLAFGASITFAYTVAKLIDPLAGAHDDPVDDDDELDVDDELSVDELDDDDELSVDELDVDDELSVEELDVDEELSVDELSVVDVDELDDELSVVDVDEELSVVVEVDDVDVLCVNVVEVEVDPGDDDDVVADPDADCVAEDAIGDVVPVLVVVEPRGDVVECDELASECVLDVGVRSAGDPSPQAASIAPRATTIEERCARSMRTSWAHHTLGGRAHALARSAVGFSERACRFCETGARHAWITARPPSRSLRPLYCRTSRNTRFYPPGQTGRGGPRST